MKPLHSPLGASAAERWLNCPGSVSLLKHLNLGQTDEEDYQKEGTQAHEVAAQCLRNSWDAWESGADAEMADAVQVYLDVCRPFTQIPHARVYIEEHLTSASHALMYGTVDFASVADSLLNIVDFKYGQGVNVDVEENPQLMYYAYLVLGRHPDVRRVVLRVVQPRIDYADPVKRWETTAQHITEWVETQLLPTMRAIGAGAEDQLDAGEWCRFCPAKLVCPLMTGMFGAAVVADPKVLVNLSDTEVGRNYVLVSVVKMYLKALEADVFRRLSSGHLVPGAKLVQKKADRVWKEGAEDALRLGIAAPELYDPATLKSPAQVEALGVWAKGLVKEWAYKPDTGLTAALTTDKRIGVKLKSATEAFGVAVANIGESNAGNS